MMHSRDKSIFGNGCQYLNVAASTNPSRLTLSPLLRGLLTFVLKIAQTQMPHPNQSFKRKHESESPPDNTQRDPTFTPYGITPPRNAEHHSKAPKDAQRRATAASEIPQAGVCSVTHEVWPSPGGAVQYAHIIPAARSGQLDYVRRVNISVYSRC